MPSKKKKVFVLDTNVLLHDYKCLRSFQNNDLVIPIPVLEELDKFKKGFDQINYNARQVAREIDDLIGVDNIKKGARLGKGLGKLYVERSSELAERCRETFREPLADHRILAIAEHVSRSREEQVILVSKDVNLRVKARVLGIPAEDYTTDKASDMRAFESGAEVPGAAPELIDALYRDQAPLPADEAPFAAPPQGNSYHNLVSADGTQTAPVYHDAATGTLSLVGRRTAFGVEPRNLEQKFALHALLNPLTPLVSITGTAGTGKTLLALAAALELADEYDQILLARPIVSLSNRDLGFLPGSAAEKVAPYMLPLFDNLAVIKSLNKRSPRRVESVDAMQRDERLVITPLAYIRGRSLSNVFFIIDEAQNLTPHEVKTIITRAGEGAKIVFTGDIQQIDTPYLDARSNGLTYLTDKMRGQEPFAHVHLSKGERSKLAELASKLL